LAIEEAEIEDPESILRKRRRIDTKRGVEQSQLQADALTRGNIERLNRNTQLHSVNATCRSGSSLGQESPDKEISSTIKGLDPEVAFGLKWGYLPPLDDDTLAILDALFAHQPAMSEALQKVRPQFEMGLGCRNVQLDESEMLDPRQTHILNTLPQEQDWETDEERKTYETLWALDQANCMGHSNEAIFQRTMMMNLIARHCLIYRRDTSRLRLLEISVEEFWTCSPAPSRAFVEGEGSLLTKPKPDLAVSFCRERLLSDLSWISLPLATQSLASYENLRHTARRKVFHFLTIEAKKGMTSTADSAALLQSLNNASQSLYNMYEFFREAGSDHEQKFFEEVRFFSVVATTEGLTFRIHRATRVTEEADRVTDGYPLRFLYRVFKRLQSDINYNRDTVLETLKPILLAYAEETLFRLLKAAAEAIREKFLNNKDAKKTRQTIGYDLYGDSKPSKKSKKSLQGSKPTYSRGDKMSVDELNRSSAASVRDSSMRSGTTTPKVSRIKQKKRRRGPSGTRPSSLSNDSEIYSHKRQKRH